MPPRPSIGKKKLVPTREKARALILAGQVKVAGEIVTKAGRLFPESCDPEVLSDANSYASRGGVKLEHALKSFQVCPEGKAVLDVGASTGGFTDCLLRHGVQKVFAVDVGYGQLNWSVRNDSRVIVLDRQNARYLQLEQIGESVDLAVIDVSFISLQLIIPPIIKLVKPEGHMIALVKPQFEVGKEEVENRGIIKDRQKHLKVLLRLRDFIETQNWALKDITPSPIPGQKGNREFLIHIAPPLLAPGIGENKIYDLALAPSRKQT